jgi:hypothetical protein
MALGITIISLLFLLTVVLQLFLFALMFRHSLDEHHLRFKIFGLFSIRSLLYSEIKHVVVVPWWRAYWYNPFSTEVWMGYEFRRTRVMIMTNRSHRPVVLIAPSDSTAFATILSARTSRHQLQEASE